MGSARRLKPRKSPRQRRSAETVEAILGAAAQVFSARGYAGATTNHIAKRAGVSIGSLYQYFPNKDAILVALVQRHVEETAGTLQSTVQAALQSGWDLDQLLDQVVRASLRQHTAAPRLLHVLLYEAPRPPEAVALLHETEEAMARAVQELLVRFRGEQPRHAGHAAYIIVHVVESLVHEFVVHPPESLDEEAFVAELLSLLKAYLEQPCGQEARARVS